MSEFEVHSLICLYSYGENITWITVISRFVPLRSPAEPLRAGAVIWRRRTSNMPAEAGER